MELFGRDRNRITTDETEALHHPIRLRILEIHGHGHWRRLLSVEALTEALVKTPGFEHTTPAQVNYHRARLLDAELLPAA
jgi:DNA-binding transcriptional ArsR family regulator